jgi:hypothetical protein
MTPQGKLHHELQTARNEMIALAEKVRSNIKVEAISVVSPYYADISNNMYALSSEDSHDSFDMLLSGVISPEDSKVAIVKRTINATDSEFLNEVTATVEAMGLEPLDLKSVSSSNKEILGVLDKMFASECLFQIYDKRLLSEIVKVKGKSPIFKGPGWYKTCLRSILLSILKSKEKELLANSYVHVLEKRIKMITNIWSDDVKKKWLSSRRSRIPTYEMLVHGGFVPDLKLSKFKTIFFTSEWAQLDEKGILSIEQECNLNKNKKITMDNLQSILDRGSQMRAVLERDDLYKRASTVKQKRLTVAGTLSKGRRGLRDIVRAGWISDKEREMFSPFFLACMGGEYSYAEMIGKIQKVSPEKDYYMLEHAGSALPNILISAASQLIELLSS